MRQSPASCPQGPLGLGYETFWIGLNRRGLDSPSDSRRGEEALSSEGKRRKAKLEEEEEEEEEC